MDIRFEVVEDLLDYLSEPYIDKMHDLWEISHQHHATKSTYFKEFYSRYEYETFRRNLMKYYETLTFIYVYKDEEMIACCFIGNFEKIGHLGNVVVKPEYRKQGIGKKMFGLVTELCNKKGRHLNISLSYGNDTAIEFYKSLGYFPKDIILSKR